MGHIRKGNSQSTLDRRVKIGWLMSFVLSWIKDCNLMIHDTENRARGKEWESGWIRLPPIDFTTTDGIPLRVYRFLTPFRVGLLGAPRLKVVVGVLTYTFVSTREEVSSEVYSEVETSCVTNVGTLTWGNSFSVDVFDVGLRFDCPRLTKFDDSNPPFKKSTLFILIMSCSVIKRISFEYIY